MTHTIINHRPFLIFLSFIHESCVDHSDTLLDRDALRYIVPHFTTPGNSERVGAVTGNPHIQQQMEDLLPPCFVSIQSPKQTPQYFLVS
jgi:hypothetical protein